MTPFLIDVQLVRGNLERGLSLGWMLGFGVRKSSFPGNL